MCEIDESTLDLQKNRKALGTNEESVPLLPHPNATPSQPKYTELVGYVYMATSCIFLSVMSFFTHAAETIYNFKPRHALFIRGVGLTFLSTLYIISYLPLRQICGNISVKQWKLLAFRGLAGALGMISFLTALQKLNVGDAVTLYFFGPVITIFLSHIVLKEPITSTDIIAASTSITGILLIAHPGLNAPIIEAKSDHIIGVIGGILGAFFSSVSHVIIRSIGVRIHFMLFVFALACATLLLSIVVGGALGSKDLMESKMGALLILLSSFCSFGGQACLSKGLQLCRAGPGSLMRNLEVPMAYIFGILFLRESPALLGMLGSILVLFSSIVIGIRQILPW